MSEPIDVTGRKRRRLRWIVACALPGYVALVAFALIAWLQSSRFDPPDALMLAIVPFGVLSVLCWALAPFFVLFDLVILLRDPWRRERPKSERTWLTLFVLGSPVAWFLSVGISDAYHLLR